VLDTGDLSVEDLEGCKSLLKLSGDTRMSKFDQLQISFKDQAVFLGFSSEEDVAVLNEVTSKALRDLSMLESCRFQVLVADDLRVILQGTHKNKEKDKFMHVDIVIYGLPEIGTSVGCLLSSARIYLQHPCYQDPYTKYANPHFLTLDDLFITSTHPSPVSGRRSQRNDSWTLTRSTGNSEDSSMREAFQTEIAKVFSSLTRYKTLKRLEADIKITTPLLP
jgi:SWI/SNF-related matrix-associated actin-dependent regulator of chromatin subfamily A3